MAGSQTKLLVANWQLHKSSKKANGKTKSILTRKQTGELLRFEPDNTQTCSCSLYVVDRKMKESKMEEKTEAEEGDPCLHWWEDGVILSLTAHGYKDLRRWRWRDGLGRGAR